MLCRKTEIILKEGWFYIAILTLLFFLSLLLSFSFIAFLLFIAIVATASVFRNPERIPYEVDDLSIFAPIDGKVIYIGKVKEENYYQKDMLLVTIKSSLFDVTVFRNPLDMKIKSLNTIHGLNIVADDAKARYLNQRVEIVANSKYGDIFMSVISGVCSRKIYLFCKRLKEIRKGDRYLFINEGLVHLYLPLNCRLKVTKGEKVKAAETVLGYFLNDKKS